MATLKDVASLAGVDPSTVSRVLRGDPTQAVRLETRERIRAAAQALDYRPNSIARALRSRRSQTLALLVHDLDNLGFSEVTRGVKAAADEAGYLLLLGEVSSGSQQREAYARLVVDGRVDGLLVAFAEFDDRVVAGLAERKLPLVVVQRRVDSGAASVIADDSLGSRMAVEHVLSLGHRRIAHVAGPQRADTGVRRLHGFLEGLEQAGLPRRDDWIVDGQFTGAGGHEATKRLLAVAREDRPTALYAANLVSGLGALAALREAGIGVPAEMSVVVMDEHFIAEHASPPLTTVQLPLFEVGCEAVRMLVAAIEGEPVSSRVVSEAPRLVVRSSTAPPKS